MVQGTAQTPLVGAAGGPASGAALLSYPGARLCLPGSNQVAPPQTAATALAAPGMTGGRDEDVRPGRQHPLCAHGTGPRRSRDATARPRRVPPTSRRLRERVPPCQDRRTTHGRGPSRTRPPPRRLVSGRGPRLCRASVARGSVALVERDRAPDSRPLSPHNGPQWDTYRPVQAPNPSLIQGSQPARGRPAPTCEPHGSIGAGAAAAVRGSSPSPWASWAAGRRPGPATSRSTAQPRG